MQQVDGGQSESSGIEEHHTAAEAVVAGDNVDATIAGAEDSGGDNTPQQDQPQAEGAEGSADGGIPKRGGGLKLALVGVGFFAIAAGGYYLWASQAEPSPKNKQPVAPVRHAAIPLDQALIMGNSSSAARALAQAQLSSAKGGALIQRVVSSAKRAPVAAADRRQLNPVPSKQAEPRHETVAAAEPKKPAKPHKLADAAVHKAVTTAKKHHHLAAVSKKPHVCAVDNDDVLSALEKAREEN